MDRVAKLRNSIVAAIKDFASEYGKPDEGVEIRSIVDETHSIFQLVVIGWQGVERIYHILFHLEIKGDKVWIQEDNTESGIASFLLKNGLSKQDIVLAFYSESYRRHTEFAVA
jgi:XisI protein